MGFFFFEDFGELYVGCGVGFYGSIEEFRSKVIVLGCGGGVKGLGRERFGSVGWLRSWCL